MEPVRLLVREGDDPNPKRKVTKQSVAHGAAGRVVSEIYVVRRSPVNGGVLRLRIE